MLIELTHGEPIRFGEDNELGVISNHAGSAEIVNVADVGEDALLVHDETREDPSVAFAISRLASGPYQPTPVGVFRAVQRPEYATIASQQLAVAQDQQGPGDLHKLLHSQPTWTVT